MPPLICIPGIAGTADVFYKQIMFLSMKVSVPLHIIVTFFFLPNAIRFVFGETIIFDNYIKFVLFPSNWLVALGINLCNHPWASNLRRSKWTYYSFCRIILVDHRSLCDGIVFQNEAFILVVMKRTTWLKKHWKLTMFMQESQTWILVLISSAKLKSLVAPSFPPGCI